MSKLKYKRLDIYRGNRTRHHFNYESLRSREVVHATYCACLDDAQELSVVYVYLDKQSRCLGPQH